MNIVPFVQLESADLVVDAVYEGGTANNWSAEPLSKLLPRCGNRGGFRIVGGSKDPKYVVLYSSMEDLDWPDDLDMHTGRFDYYGDNKIPGNDIHDTKKRGNRFLEVVFNQIHSMTPNYRRVPPFLVFAKSPTANSSRSVQFKGLAVPGFPAVPATDDLTAIWRSKDGQRFQNYRAIFTVLDVPVVRKDWLLKLTTNSHFTVQDAPTAWLEWANNGTYRPLISPPTKTIRSAQDQVPLNKQQEDIVATIYTHFRPRPTAFEAFACEIFAMHEHPRVSIDYVTRPSRDGGRDAVGKYRFGVQDDPVYAEFALEAKLWNPPINGKPQRQLGVKEVQRLISRIKHRQFGVIVTTGVIHNQAYSEVREDEHPIIFLCARDIAEILIERGLSTPAAVLAKLEKEFPVAVVR